MVAEVVLLMVAAFAWVVGSAWKKADAGHLSIDERCDTTEHMRGASYG